MVAWAFEGLAWLHIWHFDQLLFTPESRWQHALGRKKDTACRSYDGEKLPFAPTYKQ